MCLCFLQSEGSLASPWPPKPCRAQAQPAPVALASLKPTKRIPTSGPLLRLALLPRVLFPRASQGCLLYSGLTSNVISPDRPPRPAWLQQKPMPTHRAITQIVSFPEVARWVCAAWGEGV